MGLGGCFLYKGKRKRNLCGSVQAASVPCWLVPTLSLKCFILMFLRTESAKYISEVFVFPSCLMTPDKIAKIPSPTSMLQEVLFGIKCQG